MSNRTAFQSTINRHKYLKIAEASISQYVFFRLEDNIVIGSLCYSWMMDVGIRRTVMYDFTIPSIMTGFHYLSHITVMELLATNYYNFCINKLNK